MSNPVCISPLKFYDSLAKQSHRKSYAYGHISPLITKTGWIPPFQFVIPSHLYNSASNISEFKLYSAKTNEPIVSISQSQSVPLVYSSDVEGTFIGYEGQYIQNQYFGHQVFAIESGKTYAIDYRYSGDVNIGPLYWADENNNFIGHTDFVVGPITKTDEVVVAPVNAAYAYLNYQKAFKGVTALKSVSFSYEIKTIDSYKLFISNGFHLLNIPEGLYYLKIVSENGGLWTYYSEVFCFTNVTKDCLELEYWNETGNFAIKNGVIAFPSGFHFKLLLKGEIGKPEYNFEEESTKRLGYVYVESQVSKKTYKFNVVVPEYICDALRIVRLCDNKIIRCKDDEYEAISFEMEAEWQTQGDLASVTCEFETDNVVANIGGFVPDKLGGDYNNDYNEDFDKE